MYGFPKELDLTSILGESTTQLRVGQFDLQFQFGTVSFAVQSPVCLFRDSILVASWAQGKWPAPGFYDIMNTEVKRCEILSDKILMFEFENGIEMHLRDHSDQFESMTITIDGVPNAWII